MDGLKDQFQKIIGKKDGDEESEDSESSSSSSGEAPAL